MAGRKVVAQKRKLKMKLRFCPSIPRRRRRRLRRRRRRHHPSIQWPFVKSSASAENQSAAALIFGAPAHASALAVPAFGEGDSRGADYWMQSLLHSVEAVACEHCLLGCFVENDASPWQIIVESDVSLSTIFGLLITLYQQSGVLDFYDFVTVGNLFQASFSRTYVDSRKPLSPGEIKGFLWGWGYSASASRSSSAA